MGEAAFGSGRWGVVETISFFQTKWVDTVDGRNPAPPSKTVDFKD